LAFAIDAFSRLIAGWKGRRAHAHIMALDALEMAVSARLRAGHSVTGLVHHSDHGSQYLAIRYTRQARRSRRDHLRRVQRRQLRGESAAGISPAAALRVK